MNGNGRKSYPGPGHRFSIQNAPKQMEDFDSLGLNKRWKTSQIIDICLPSTSHYFMLPIQDIKHNLISCSSNNATIHLPYHLREGPSLLIYLCYNRRWVTIPYIRTSSNVRSQGVIYRTPGFLAVVIRLLSPPFPLPRQKVVSFS